jgi:hypothetical protein
VYLSIFIVLCELVEGCYRCFTPLRRLDWRLAALGAKSEPGRASSGEFDGYSQLVRSHIHITAVSAQFESLAPCRDLAFKSDQLFEGDAS